MNNSQIGNPAPCKLAEVVASVVKDVLVSGEIPVAKIVRDLLYNCRVGNAHRQRYLSNLETTIGCIEIKIKP